MGRPHPTKKGPRPKTEATQGGCYKECLGKLASGSAVAARELVGAQFALRGGEAGNWAKGLGHARAGARRRRTIAGTDAGGAGAVPRGAVHDLASRRFKRGCQHSGVTGRLSQRRRGGGGERTDRADDGQRTDKQGARKRTLENSGHDTSLSLPNAGTEAPGREGADLRCWAPDSAIGIRLQPETVHCSKDFFVTSEARLG